MRRSPLRPFLSVAPLWMVIALAGDAATLGAQTPQLVRERHEPACYDSIPPSAYSRVVAYAHIEGDSLPDAAARSILFSADALLQGIVERTRAALGAAPDVLPTGEPKLGDSLHVWRAVSRDLLITAYRDGHVVSRIDTVGRDSAAAVLLRRSLTELTDGGESFIWPSDDAAMALDSVHLRVALSWAGVDSAGRPHPAERKRALVALFSMLVPWEEPVRPWRMPQPHYPDVALTNGIRGTALIQFVVDTAGKPDIRTMRDLNAARAARLPGEERAAYLSFVRAAREAIEQSRYKPARIGGCTVRQLVQQPFTFDIR
jgi:hypothetical protein